MGLRVAPVVTRATSKVPVYISGNLGRMLPANFGWGGNLLSLLAYRRALRIFLGLDISGGALRIFLADISGWRVF